MALVRRVRDRPDRGPGYGWRSAGTTAPWLRAESVAELGEKIRADYQNRPIPRKDNGPWLP